MDAITIGVIVAGAAIGLLLSIFFLRKYRLRRYRKQIESFSSDVLSKRLRRLNDKVRQALYTSLETIYSGSSSSTADEQILQRISNEIFGSEDANHGDSVISVCQVKTGLVRSSVILQLCKVHVERGLQLVHSIVRDKELGNVFRGPHQQKRPTDDEGSGDAAATANPTAAQAELEDLLEGRPRVGCLFYCCMCITDATQEELLRNQQLLYFYNMAHQLCAGQPLQHSKKEKEEETNNGGLGNDVDGDGSGSRSVTVEMEDLAHSQSGDRVGAITLRFGDTNIDKMLHPGNCIARQLVEVTAHAKKQISVTPSGHDNASRRYLVDVRTPRKFMYSQEQTDALLKEVFLWRPASSSSEGAPNLGKEVEELLVFHQPSTTISGDEDTHIVHLERCMWLNGIQDKFFFSAGGLREDLFAYFANLRRVILSTANTDKQSMGMYDAIRVFDVSVKLWMLHMTKQAVDMVSLEWQRRVLLQARKIVQDGRRDILLVAADASTNNNNAANITSSSGVYGEDDADDTATAMTDSSPLFALQAGDAESQDVLIIGVVQRWLYELHDAFAESVPVAPAKRGSCCRKCLPSFPAVTAKVPESDTAVLKLLQGRVRISALRQILTQDQQLFASAQSAPIRERLLDLILPTSGSPDGSVFSPREEDGNRRNTETPPPPPGPPPPSCAVAYPEPPPRRIDDVTVTVDESEDNSSPESSSEMVTARTRIIEEGLRQAMNDVAGYVDEAMEKIEIDLAEKLILSGGGEASQPLATGSAERPALTPIQLKQFLKTIKKKSTKRLTYLCKHISLMLDCLTSSRALCAANAAGKSHLDAFKNRVARFHQQLMDFKNNLQESSRSSTLPSFESSSPSCSLTLTMSGCVLGGAATFEFVPMRDVVQVYNFHATQFQDLPQHFTL